jgi:actin-related protein 6
VLIDPDLQSKIWKSIFPSTITSLVYTCPLYTPPSSRRLLDELIYEDFNISEALRVPTGINKNCLLIDLGFSASVVTPIYQGLPISYALKRVNVGGKLLTNYLKEQISYRSFDMTEETWLVNHIREQMCSVSQNFLSELRSLQ